MPEAAVGISTFSLVLAAAVIVAGAAFAPAALPAWLASVPLGLVVIESAMLLVYAVRIARTGNEALEDERKQLKAEQDAHERATFGETAKELDRLERADKEGKP